MTDTPRDEFIQREWWKESVIYQIYPRSFNDTNGDGVGDIPGIIEKLDYLDDLGVDIIWLNPVYESPNADNGYDIADYQSIMDEFGTMEDWENLLEGLHDRDIKLIMDLVVNHTSDEHEWFVNSRDTESEYHDYYIWKHGRTDIEGFTGHAGPPDEAPPNEWESFFGGPAWAYDDEVGKWYLHLFDEKQPDLNWENPDVRDEIFEMMEWWLDKGIDGFRMDVINLLSKPDSVTQHDPPLNTTNMWETFDGPRMQEFLDEMYDRVLKGRDVFALGEMMGRMDMEIAKDYVEAEGPLSTLFHFDHVLLDHGGAIWERNDWDLNDLRDVLNRWQYGLDQQGWNSIYLSNHDQPRLVSRFGNDGEYRKESAKLLATLIFTLRGTPYIFQGAEIGMTNYPFDSLDEFRDVETINPVRNALDSGEIENFDDVKHALRQNSRDNARTPMQWSTEDNAGFTDGEPWIGVNPNYTEINVAEARDDPDSIWNYYRELIELRKEHDVLVYGHYDVLINDHEEIWSYIRTLGDERLLVTLNFAEWEGHTWIPEGQVDFDPHEMEAELLLSNYGADERATDVDAWAFDLRPWEARIYRLTESD
jgi:oligo-1,6-glucosidase